MVSFKNQWKIGIVLFFLIGFSLFWIYDLQHYLTLDYLRSSKTDLLNYYSANPLFTIILFGGIYTILTAFSIPLAAVLTLAGGALFGLIMGTIVVSIASTLGATCAMLASRLVIGDYVQQRFKKQFEIINQKIDEEGIYYLFSLRLIVLFPFFVVNLVMGLTSMRAFTYAWVSQLGMLPATVVYVNVGTELGKINSLGDVASPSLWFAFALLGIFPLVIKKLVAFLKKGQLA